MFDAANVAAIEEDVVEAAQTKMQRTDGKDDVHAALVSQEWPLSQFVHGTLPENVVARTHRAWSWLSNLDPLLLFQDLDKVHKVNLMDKNIGPGGLDKLVLVLPYMTSLVSLDLARCHIGPQLTENLSPILPRMIHLQRLIVSDNNIGAAGTEKLATAVASMPNLQMLDVRRNNIGAGGAEMLAMAAARMPNLQMIDIRQNNIGDDSAEKLVAAVCLLARDAGALKVLWLGENSIGDTAQENIKAAVARNTAMPQNCKLVWGQSP